MTVPVLQVAAAGGVEPLVALFVALGSFLVPMIVSVLVYRDASRRGSRHALA